MGRPKVVQQPGIERKSLLFAQKHSAAIRAEYARITKKLEDAELRIHANLDRTDPDNVARNRAEAEAVLNAAKEQFSQFMAELFIREIISTEVTPAILKMLGRDGQT
jgi:hypothetical protein